MCVQPAVLSTTIPTYLSYLWLPRIENPFSDTPLKDRVRISGDVGACDDDDWSWVELLFSCHTFPLDCEPFSLCTVFVLLNISGGDGSRCFKTALRKLGLRGLLRVGERDEGSAIWPRELLCGKTWSPVMTDGDGWYT